MLRNPACPVASVLMAAMILTPAFFAFDTPLSDQAVRDAYFLGQRRDEKMAALLSAYVKRFALPEKGPYISEIELLTPYAQVVDISRKRSAGYSAQQAALDYRERRDTIVMRVKIEFTATYTATESVQTADGRHTSQGIRLRSNDFWRDFRFGLSQDARWLQPRSQHGEPFYGGDGSHESSSQLRGAQVYIEFDSKDVASELAQAEVFTPDGQHAVATFDLATLR